MPTPKYILYESREEWLNARRLVITSTDVGQIVGVSKWGDRLKVYAEKTGSAKDEASEQMIIGRHVQAGIASAYAEIREERGNGGVLIEHVPNFALYFHGKRPTHAASMDCWQLMKDGSHVPRPLEIKSTGSYPDEPYDEWITQVQWQIYVTDSHGATICALCGGDDIRYWDIERDDELIAPLAEAADAFIEQFLIPQTPPPPDSPQHSGRALRQIYKQSVEGLEVTMDMHDLDIVLDLNKLKQDKKGIEAEIGARENALMAKMGKAEVAYLPNGQKITWRTAERKGYSVPAGTSRRFVIGKEPD